MKNKTTAMNEAQFLDFRFKLGDRLLEFEKSGFHSVDNRKRPGNSTAAHAGVITAPR